MSDKVIGVAVDYKFFTDEYGSNRVDEAEFNRLKKRAINLAVRATDYRLTDDWFDNAHDRLKHRVRMAICSQIEYAFDTGGDSEANAESLNSVSIGNFSYSKGTRSDGSISADNNQSSQDMSDYLLQTGLLYKGVGTVGGI